MPPTAAAELTTEIEWVDAAGADGINGLRVRLEAAGRHYARGWGDGHLGGESVAHGEWRLGRLNDEWDEGGLIRKIRIRPSLDHSPEHDASDQAHALYGMACRSD